MTPISRPQASVERTVGRMAALGLCPASECGVFFGQLLGMADHLTFTLGRSGYRVSRLSQQPALGQVKLRIGRRRAC